MTSGAQDSEATQSCTALVSEMRKLRPEERVASLSATLGGQAETCTLTSYFTIQDSFQCIRLSEIFIY